ncbi:hypothetical protein SEA_VIEENROSE_42 [Streptomyces phage VieEnRose]|nr:hypothetical protein SEA_VIEENROSE_42 [Streptomyces phage VieEnRose]
MNDETFDFFAEVKRSASLLADYYKALIDEGFTAEQAFELVKISAGGSQ